MLTFQLLFGDIKTNGLTTSQNQNSTKSKPFDNALISNNFFNRKTPVINNKVKLN